MESKVELICGAYPRFYYPKGHGFYCGNVNNILYETSSGKMTEQKMRSLLSIKTFKKEVKSVLKSFTCKKEDIREWVKEDIDDYDWINDEEYKDMSEEQKIEMIIENDEEFCWWNSVGTKANSERRKKFEIDIVSAKANTLVNCALSMKMDVKIFVNKMEEYEVKWMDALKPLI